PALGGERWLRLDVWVPSQAAAPRPSDYCVPRVPEMPEEAVERGIAGRVEVAYDVDQDGVVTAVTVDDAPLLLANAVRRWLQGCRPEPPRAQSSSALPALKAASRLRSTWSSITTYSAPGATSPTRASTTCATSTGLWSAGACAPTRCGRRTSCPTRSSARC